MNAQPLVRNKRPSYVTHGKSTAISPPLNAQVITKPTAVTLANQPSFSVTGPPSRHHWKPDSEAVYCEYLDCATEFGFFERRHHCRRCGDIFCTQHCSSYFRLDQDCQFHPKGALSRGCDSCTEEYNTWATTLQQQHTSMTDPPSSSTESSPRITSSPLQQQQPRKASLPKRQPNETTQQSVTLGDIDELEKDGSVTPSSEQSPSKNISIKVNQRNKKAANTVFTPAPSVPTDWQWSTF
ncbi:hypothetical protein [Absidia glauca]|uniref:FYVE-type domain-containing protein n=1 Tax=Absidia glauca TaxID=4829 RepID=A0A168SVL9_ABSGL|nr:hypothetical protein [Absidia glauca]